MENIVIVDKNDVILGEEDKERCHDGDGILHRGFLVMCFDKKGDLLLARRANEKRLWNGFWDGTVASHVFRGEDYEQASKRRLRDELGLVTDNVEYLFKFHYKVRYKDIGTENEICAVLTAKDVETDEMMLNPEEISEIKTISLPELADDLRNNKELYTPWLILAVELLNIVSTSRSGSAYAENMRP